MDMLLYVLFALVSVSVLLSLLAIARLGQQAKATKELDWEAVAELTGDCATIKRQVQKLNNRLNGIEHGAKKDDGLITELLSTIQSQNTQSRGAEVYDASGHNPTITNGAGG